jgi:predicted ferric reductase
MEVIDMLKGTLPWYVARSSGLVAWGLLAAAVVWGLLMTSKVLRGRVKNSWLLDLHRWLGGLALTFTGVHVLAIMGDSYIHFGLASVLVPLATTWHPVAVAWGVVSLYLLAAVELTSLVRKHLAHRLWKRVHMLSLPLFVLSTVHGLTAGTDARKPMYVIGAVVVGILAAVRVQVRAERSRAAITRAPAARREPAPERVALRREPVGASAR